jgi:hypothetical protein
VILASPFREQASDNPLRRMTLDDLFRRAVSRGGDTMALMDPPDRRNFTDGEPKRLTYAQTDRIVGAIAGRLKELGLKTDALVALQSLPHLRPLHPST